MNAANKHLSGIFLLLLGIGLLAGCAGEFQSTDSGSSAAFDPPADTSLQDSIDRMNQQMAADAAANAVAQQQFNAAMAAAQETMNNANNDRATSNW